MNHKTWLPQIAGLALVVALLGSCGTPTPVPPTATSALEGREWVLISLNGESPIEGTEITLNLQKEYLGGSMGCNGYGGGPDSGRYATTDDGTLTVFRPLAVTVQLCSSPEGIMEQEATYIEALQSGVAYRVVDDRFEIDDAAGETVLAFTAEATR